jgi:hypothetical protein
VLFTKMKNLIGVRFSTTAKGTLVGKFLCHGEMVKHDNDWSYVASNLAPIIKERRKDAIRQTHRKRTK